MNYDDPKQQSTVADDAGETALGEFISPLVAQYPGRSGFRLQSDGISALASRFLLAEHAERTIDTQYYLITDDMVGLLFLGSLLDSADRGVKVRLLIDDILTQGYDAGMAALDSHPNMQVRVFNPWSARSIRFLNLGSFRALNRRMHNKSFTIDKQITIIGGRNIADEYFGAAKDVNFGDFDTLAIGPVVQDVSDMFEQYWTSSKAVPVAQVATIPADIDGALCDLRARIAAVEAEARQSRYGGAVLADIEAYLHDSEDRFDWSAYDLAFDSPDKADVALADKATNITTKLSEVIEGANEELIVVSPYFVPRRSGLEYFQQLIDRGLKVTVITNSLAANNHAVVHSGYMSYRKRLLKMGVRLFEVKATASVAGVERGGSGASLATLHSKAFLVDRDNLFVGSFNWDPRSVHLNTELGVIIRSEDLGQRAYELIEEGMQARMYEVLIAANGRLEWLDRSGFDLRVVHHEPDTSLWRRIAAQMGRLLPIRGQL